MDDNALDAKMLAQMMAQALVDQDIEIDNLGDNESVVLMDSLPTINLVQMGESLIEQFHIWLTGRREGVIQQ